MDRHAAMDHGGMHRDAGPAGSPRSWLAEVYRPGSRRGVLGTVPLIVGGLLIAVLPWVSGAGAKIALLVIGTGLTGPIYVGARR